MATTIPAPNTKVQSLIPAANPSAINPLALGQSFSSGNPVANATNAMQTPAPVSSAPMTPLPPAQPTPLASKPATTQNSSPGSYQGQALTAGTDAQIAAQMAAIDAKYKQGLQTVQQSGIPAPKTSGEGSAMVNSIAPRTQQPTINPVEVATQEDKAYQKIIADQQVYMNTVSQQKSAEQSYNDIAGKVTSEYGQGSLGEINTKLVNWAKVINGTEDDIRNEIQSSGGLATNSQVMALAGARNKQLIQNYNSLAQTKSNIENQINTMMGFSKEDKQMAIDNALQQLDFDNQNLKFVQQATNNAKEGYNAIIKQAGYAGLLQSLDPSEIPIVERTLGYAPGQLSNLATYKAPVSEEDQLNIDLKKSQLLTDEYQRGNIASQINERDNQNQPGIGGVDQQTISKIQSSPESKTITGLLPAVQAIKAYSEAISSTGGYEWWSGTKKGELQGTYGNALAAWKTLAGLGALSGADFGLAENAIPTPGFFQQNSTMQSKLNTSLKNAVSQAENLTKRLSKNYPQAAPLLDSQLDDVYLIAYPDKYKRGEDGQVYTY